MSRRRRQPSEGYPIERHGNRIWKVGDSHYRGERIDSTPVDDLFTVAVVASTLDEQIRLAERELRDCELKLRRLKRRRDKETGQGSR